MGLPIIGHLTTAGFRVECCDNDPDRQRLAREAGASIVRDVADLSPCGVILLFVPTDDDVRQVSETYLKAAAPGSVIVVCSSVLPETCAHIAEAAAGARATVVDAALTGGIRGAADGKINLLVGGETGDVARVASVFRPWTNNVHHVGPLGMGQVGKTVNNLIHWGEIVVITEALSLGAKLGVPVSRMREALKGGSVDGRTLRELEDMRFTWFEKDIDNAKSMAVDVPAELPIASYMQECMRSISVSAMADLLGDRATIELPAKPKSL
jgi:3-hydroxyisobutyrate dehydrogenase-like beta-hydroxyacid dehydrogenase